jgi:hypothetical protein
MKKGDIVTIYEDPITQEKPEGEAQLIVKENVSDELQYWKVKFLDDGFVCERWIYNKGE